MKLTLLIFSFLIFNLYSYSQYSEELFEKSITEFEKGNVLLADSLITISINYERNNFRRGYLKYYNRGIFRFDMDSITKAISDFDTTLILKDDFYPALENRAICYYLRNDLEKANLDIDKVIRINSSYIEAYVLSSIISMNMKNFEKSISVCTQGLIVEKDSRLYLYRAISYFKNNKNDLAIKDIHAGELLFGYNNEDLMLAKLYYYFINENPLLCDLKKKFMKHNYSMNFFGNIEFEKKYNECCI